MERAVSHDDAARTSILKPESDGYREGKERNRGKGAKKEKDGGEKRSWMHVSPCITVFVWTLCINACKVPFLSGFKQAVCRSGLC